MGLTSALFAGLSGMKSNEFRMDVIGDNIANVNTTAFKSSRVTFQTQFSRTFTYGSVPDGTFGGMNPLQVGSGSGIGAISRDFSGGAPETTGIKSDMTIQGAGLFVVKKADGSPRYTRDGSFRFNAANYLISADGHFLQGYPVDEDFNIIEGTLDNIRIPIGEITTSKTTTAVSLSGTLNAGGDIPTARHTNLSQAFTTGGGDIAVGTNLVDLESDGSAILVDGNVITLSGATKGGALLAEKTFDVTATSTVSDFMEWFEDVLGINTTAGIDLGPSVDDPGVTLITAGADINKLQVVGNVGDSSILNLADAIEVSQGTGASLPAGSKPFVFSPIIDNSASYGESCRTSFPSYDSLGNAINVVMTFVLTEKTNGEGTVWQFFAESDGDTENDRTVGTGAVTFSSSGVFVESTNSTVSIKREDIGADTPMNITIDFSPIYAPEGTNSITMLSQDGSPSGTLQDYSIGSDGIITGSFTNGLNQSLGQVVIATFRNYEGLVAEGDNLYTTGPNSGNPINKMPQQLGAGTITPNALELSNVDLSREFINLIVSSTGFSASSRVIQTSDELLSELIRMV